MVESQNNTCNISLDMSVVAESPPDVDSIYEYVLEDIPDEVEEEEEIQGEMPVRPDPNPWSYGGPAPTMFASVPTLPL